MLKDKLSQHYELANKMIRLDYVLDYQLLAQSESKSVVIFEA